MNLGDIRKFTAQLAPRILIHGAEGVGKTTIASKFPAPIYLQTEDGCPSGLEINSFGPINKFEDLRSAIGVLASELGRSASLPTAMRRAAVAASLACTIVGAMPSFPARAQIDAALLGSAGG